MRGVTGLADELVAGFGGYTYSVAGSGAHQLPHIAAAQGIALALRGEEPQLLALLIRQ